MSKILWFLLAPANMITVLAALAWLFHRWNRFPRFPVMLGSLAAGLLLCFGVLPLGKDALVYLEKSYQKPVRMPAHIDGILVLGGSVENTASVLSGMPEFNDGVDRIHAALLLGRRYPKAEILFSGGYGRLLGFKRPESIEIGRFLKQMGIDNLNVKYEDQSRTTYENIINSSRIVHPKPGQTWLLVTSAYHMPRAMGVAAKLGWGFIPYPVDYRGSGQYSLIPDTFDVLGNLYATQLALREVIGMAGYRVTGKL